MAAYGPAIDRIRFLAGLSDRPQYTPRTLSLGVSHGVTAIFSYRKPIAWLAVIPNTDGQTRWEVTTDTSTRTTNRHIRAAHIALLD